MRPEATNIDPMWCRACGEWVTRGTAWMEGDEAVHVDRKDSSKTCGPVVDATQDGRYVVQIATGEVLDIVTLDAPGEQGKFHVHDRESADWVASLYADVDSDDAAAKARLEMYRRNVGGQIADLKRRREGLDHRFLAELREWARTATKGRTKHVKLDHGKLAFRDGGRGRLVIEDEQAAAVRLEALGSQAVSMVPKIAVGDLTAEHRAALVAEGLAREEGAGETFKIDTGSVG